MKIPPTLPVRCLHVNQDGELIVRGSRADIEEFPHNIIYQRVIFMRESDFKELVAEIEKLTKENT